MPSIKRRYTQEQFLEYYKFEDEPLYVPRTFHARQKGYENLLKNVAADVRVGVKLENAVCFNAGVDRTTYFRWKRYFSKEIKAGKSDTPLIRLFMKGLRADGKLYREVMELALDKARSGDASTIQYLAKHRLGYNSVQKQEVELSSKEEVPIKFVFTDMTPVDDNED